MDRIFKTWSVIFLLISGAFAQDNPTLSTMLMMDPNGISSVQPASVPHVRPEIDSGSSSQFQQFDGFSERTDAYGVFNYLQSGDVAKGDLNNDGLMDILFVQYNATATAQSHYQPMVWIQNYDGTFSDQTLELLPELNAPSLDAEISDIDGDGHNDILIGGFVNADLVIPGIILRNTGNNHFENISDSVLSSLPPGYILRYVETGHFNSDDEQDIAGILVKIAQDYHAIPALMANLGNGHFSLADTTALNALSDYGWFGLSTGDLNGDGFDDLVFANMRQTVQTETGWLTRSGRTAAFVSDGQGHFTDITPQLPPEDGGFTRMVKVADINNDRLLDIIEVAFIVMPGERQIRAFINEGNGTFAEDEQVFPKTAYGWVNDILIEDFNRDGNGDCFMATVGWNENNVQDNTGQDALLLGDGEGRMVDVSSNLPNIPDHSVGAVSVDANRDGKPDIVLGNAGNEGNTERSLIYENNFQTLGISESKPLAGEFALDNYPNPFNPGTTISFSLPVSSDVSIYIYNFLGQMVWQLHPGRLKAGTHQYRWEARSATGQLLPTGLYVVRVVYQNRYITHKMILTR